MPLLPGKKEIGHNIAEMEKAGHPRKHAIAAALRTAGVPKKNAEEDENSPKRLPNVEIFAAGTHRDKTYTPADLDDMAANFKRFSTGKKPGFSVPAVLGHEEDQKFLEREDLPAAGWVSRVWRDGDKLKADFEDVPPAVARLIKRKGYRTCSSEVYDDPEAAGLQGKGKMLRRVAFLGGSIPQLKTLADLPMPESYSEPFAPGRPTRLKFRHAIELAPGRWQCFAESVPMDKAEMIRLLAEHGCDTAALERADEDALAEMLRVCDDKDDRARSAESTEDENKGQTMPFDQQQQQGAQTAPPPAPNPDEQQMSGYDDEGFPEPKDDEEKGHLAMACRRMAERCMKGFAKYSGRRYDEVPEDDEEMKGYAEKFDELPEEERGKLCDRMSAHKYAAKDNNSPEFGKRFAGAIAKGIPPSQAGAIARSNENHTERFSEQRLRQLIREEVNSGAADIRKTKAELDRHARLLRVEAFCEQEFVKGHLDRNEYKPQVARKPGEEPSGIAFDLMMSLDDRDKVTKFSEGGKTIQLTPLEAYQRTISKRHSLFNGGNLRGQAGPVGASDEDAEVNAVERHFESFSEDFRRLNSQLTREQFVEGFKAARKHSPGLTAKSFLGTTN